jgi:hypothetical protein
MFNPAMPVLDTPIKKAARHISAHCPPVREIKPHPNFPAAGVRQAVITPRVLPARSYTYSVSDKDLGFTPAGVEASAGARQASSITG